MSAAMGDQTTPGESLPEKRMLSERYSRSRRLVTVFLYFFFCVFSSGVIFGFPVIKPVLLQSGVYYQLCSTVAQAVVQCCTAQILRLSLMFTLAASANNIFSLPLGYLLDKCGPRLLSFVAYGLMVLALILFAFGSPSFDSFIPGFVFLSISGNAVFMASIWTTRLFDRHSGIIMGSLSCAFDASAIVFLIFKAIYDGTNGKASILILFLSYLVIPVAGCCVYAILSPRRATLKEATEAEIQRDDRKRSALQETAIDDLPQSTALVMTSDDTTSPQPISADNKKSEKKDSEKKDSDKIENNIPVDREKTPPSSDVTLKETPSFPTKKTDSDCPVTSTFLPLDHMPFWHQMKTHEFWLSVAFDSIFMLLNNFYLLSVNEQLAYYGSRQNSSSPINAPSPTSSCSDAMLPAVTTMITTMSILLPVGGVLSVPLVGWSLDSLGHIWTFSITITLTVVFQIIILIPNLPLQYVALVIFVVQRAYIFTSIVHYVSVAFGMKHFGKLYGVMVLIASVFGLIQYLFNYIALSVMGGNYIAINITLLVLACIMYCFPYYLWKKKRRQSRQTKAILITEEIKDDGAAAHVMLSSAIGDAKIDHQDTL